MQNSPIQVILLAIFLLPAISALASYMVEGLSSQTKTYFSREFVWTFASVSFLVFSTWQAKLSKLTAHPLPRIDALLLLVLLFVSICVNQLAAPYPLIAFQRLLILVLMFAVGYASYLMCLNLQEKFTFSVLVALLFGAVLHIPFVIGLLYLQTGTEDIVWQNSIPGFRGVRPYGYVIEVGIAAGVGLLALSKSQFRGFKTLTFISVALLWMMLFWSGSRGALMALIVALIVVSVLFRHNAKGLWAHAVSSMILGAILSLFLWVPDSIFFGIENMFLRTYISDGTLDQVSSGRMELWKFSWQQIQIKPLFGYGLNQFVPLEFLAGFKVDYPQPHAHNSLLESLLSWGLVGTGIAIAIFVRAALAISRQIKTPNGGARLPAVLALSVLLLHSMISGTYFHIHSLFYIAIIFGICLAPNPAQNGNTNR